MIITRLQTESPDLFPHPTNDLEPVPWARNIGNQIMIRYRCSKRVARLVLSTWLETNREDYLQAVADGGHRFDLDGQKDGVVTEGERDRAGRELETVIGCGQE